MSYTLTRNGWTRDLAPPPAPYHDAGKPRLLPAWWRANRRYTGYMLRELASVSNAIWSVQLLLQINQVKHGRKAYEAMITRRRRPAWRAFHVVSLLFAILHSVTFLLAAGKGPTVQLQGRHVPERAMATGAFMGWGATSLLILLVLLVGGRKKATDGKGKSVTA